MIKFPNNAKTVLVTNGKNAFQGTISYTKNIDLDEEGVIKLSPPMVKIFSSVDDGDLQLPIDIFSYSSTGYKVISPMAAFNFPITTLSFTKDSGNTTYTDSSRVVPWVNGDWYVNGDAVYSYTGATGTTVYTSRVATVLEFIELFANRNTLVGVFGDNVVKQYNTSYTNTTDLTIAENFAIKGLSFSNNSMGIITRQKKNLGNAYFFFWDGKTTEANAGYPVNDSFITAIKAYKSSWVITTSAGQVLYFNGGGFDILGTLPTFNYEDDLVSLAPSQDITIGNTIDVIGDIFYINVASLPEFSSSEKSFRPFFSGGLYCYDPKVGLYHRHAPSYSEYKEESGTSASDVITFGSAHFLETGDEVWLANDDQGLTAGTYFAIYVSSTTIKLANSYANAFTGTSVTITDGTIVTWFVKRKDFGIDALRVNDLGLVKKDRNYAGFADTGIIPTFMGSKIRPNSVTSSRVFVLNALAPKMANRGRIVTAKFQTDNIKDVWQEIALKYTKLTEQSSIVIKTKTMDVEPIVVGDTTLYNDSYSGGHVIWDTSSRFVTASDLTGAEVGDEVYIFDGAAAGQSAHITEITSSSGGWTVTVDEPMRGASSGGTSCISIDKYKKLGTILASELYEGVKRITIGEKSPSIELVIELRGINVRLTEVQIINSQHSN